MTMGQGRLGGRHRCPADRPHGAKLICRVVRMLSTQLCGRHTDEHVSINKQATDTRTPHKERLRHLASWPPSLNDGDHESPAAVQQGVLHDPASEA